MPLFRDKTTIVNDMVADFLAITGITLDPSDLSREEVINIHQYAIAFSSLYSALQRADDDVHPADAGVEALILHLAERQMPGQIQAQPSSGSIAVTATGVADIPIGTSFKHVPTGNIYVSTQDTPIAAAGTFNVPCQSSVAGQAQNISTTGDAFTLVAPIANVNTNAVGASPFLNGRDLETGPQMLARIQAHDQNLNTGGNLTAYEEWAQAASAQVVTANAQKTAGVADGVTVVITAGTTNIDAAVDGGTPVVRVPTAGLLAAVAAYIAAQNPTTDVVSVIGPVEAAFNVTVSFNLFDETLRANVNTLVSNAVQKFIYKAVPGTTIWPSDLERELDLALGYLIKSREVGYFNGANASYAIPIGTLLKPGVITLQAFV